MLDVEKIIEHLATSAAKRIIRDKALGTCLMCDEKLTCARCANKPIKPVNKISEPRLTELVFSELSQLSDLIEAVLEERAAEVKHAVAIRDEVPQTERAKTQGNYMLAINKRREAVDALALAHQQEGKYAN